MRKKETGKGLQGKRDRKGVENSYKDRFGKRKRKDNTRESEEL